MSALEKCCLRKDTLEARQDTDDTISLSSPRGARETAGRALRYRAALCCLKSEMTTS